MKDDGCAPKEAENEIVGGRILNECYPLTDKLVGSRDARDGGRCLVAIDL